MQRAFITGLAGPTLSNGERDFLRGSRPAGIILFKRNCDTPEQIRRLVGTALAAVGDDGTLVAIDQEGGRVQRLAAPHWSRLPAAGAIARSRDPQMAAWSAALVAGRELAELGITMDCAPVADLRLPGAHEIIGDRAFGDAPDVVAALARSFAEGLIAAGVVPVVKHVPGHGRACADSHLELPVVDAARDILSETDFAPFRRLRDLPAMMTAHVVYSAIDAGAPASTSARVTGDVIRGEIGFDGLLISDDLGMRALAGPMRARAEAVIAAGSDVALHCSGDLGEMHDVAAGVPMIDGVAFRRLEACRAITRRAISVDVAEARAVVARTLAG